MPKILITGNGFDLNYNLPTTYKDFILIVTKLTNSSDFRSALKQSDNYDKIDQTFLIDRHTIDKEGILKLTESKSENLWFHFFKNELEIETWIDFENRIELVLEMIYSAVETIRNTIFHKGAVECLKEDFDYSLLQRNIVQIGILKSFKIINDNSGRITINEDFFVSRNAFIIDIDLKKITKYLYDNLLDFQRIFIQYFELFVVPLYKLQKLTENKIDLTRINYFFTFNYTPTLSKINKIAKEKIFHLHGNIEKENLVLGINEVPESISDKKNVLPFTKYYQKLSFDTDYKFLTAIKNGNNTNHIFFFWGHSLDNSDSDYINEVFDFVTDSKAKIKKIVVVYHSVSTKNILLINLLSIRGKVDIDSKTRSEQLIFLKNDSTELLRELRRDITPTTVSPITVGGRTF